MARDFGVFSKFPALHLRGEQPQADPQKPEPAKPDPQKPEPAKQHEPPVMKSMRLVICDSAGIRRCRSVWQQSAWISMLAHLACQHPNGPKCSMQVQCNFIMGATSLYLCKLHDVHACAKGAHKHRPCMFRLAHVIPQPSAGQACLPCVRLVDG